MAVRGRLVPLRLLLVMHAFCAFLVGVYGAMAAVEDGPVRLPAGGVALAALVLWAALLTATAVPRRREVEPRPDGSVEVAAPTALVGLLVGAWAVMLLAVAGWLLVVLSGSGSLGSPGGLLVMAVGALASLPDLVRLLTGRLHRWRVTADEQGIRYRGYRTDRSLRWSQVAGIRSQQRPLGVTVSARDAGAGLQLPALAFDVHPDAGARAAAPYLPALSRPAEASPTRRNLHPTRRRNAGSVHDQLGAQSIVRRGGAARRGRWTGAARAAGTAGCARARAR